MQRGTTWPLAAAAALLLAVPQAAAQALYGDDAPLTKLDKQVRASTRVYAWNGACETRRKGWGWEAMQMDLEHVWVVEFYADWCGHCKQFAPAYLKAASNLHGLVRFGAVNTDTASDLVSAEGVQGFPTVKVLLPEAKTNPYTGKRTRESVTYNGPRTAKALVDFVTGQMPNLVVPVTDEADLGRLLKDGASHLVGASEEAQAKRAVLFTAKAETSLLLKALALRLRGRLAVAEAKRLSDTGPVADLAAKYGVSAMPTLVVLPAASGATPEEGGAQPEVYSGDLKYQPLWDFLSAHAGPAVEVEKDAGGRRGGPKRRNLEGVAAIGPTEFAADVEPSVDAWILAFEQGATDAAEDEGDAQRLPGLARLATQLWGQARVGIVNCSNPGGAELAARLGVASFPALRLLPYGEGVKTKAAAVDVPDVTAAKRAAGESLPASAVVLLNEATVDPFMAAALPGASGRGEDTPAAACLLFSDKAAAPPLYRAVALHFAGVFGFGMVPGSERGLAQRFNVEAFPTLLCLWADGVPDDKTGQVAMQGAKFDTESMGPMSFSSLGMFLANLAEQRLGAGWQERLSKGRSGAGAGAAGAGLRGGGGAGAAPAADVTARELTAGNAAELCPPDSIGLCAIALLDGDRSPEATERREGHLRTLNGLAHRRRDDASVKVSWVDATCHDHWLAQLDVSDADLPTLVVLSPSKGRFAKLMGTFTVEGMSRFVQAVAHGRSATSPIDSLPVPDPSLDCDTALRGAAKAAALASDGDDDDGMDDIMAEILEEERQRKAALEAEEGASGADMGTTSGAAAGGPSGGKPREEMTELERLEADLEECGMTDLLCHARRDKQLKAIEKRRALEEKLAEIAEKKKAKKKKKKKAKSA